MHQDERQGLRHEVQYRSRFQRSIIAANHSWGFTPGWYGAALSALILWLLGCHSTAATSSAARSTAGQTAKIQTAAYPPRPTTPAPPVKLFHHTDTSLTLVTDANANDTQIEALVWQLRDAAHTHALAKLGPTFAPVQTFVDHNTPSTWFHIYRGPKCAGEKYTTGQLPCGASYHAAADYTLGTPGNPQWDNGLLLTPQPNSDELRETPLWDPDTPYQPHSSTQP